MTPVIFYDSPLRLFCHCKTQDSCLFPNSLLRMVWHCTEQDSRCFQIYRCGWFGIANSRWSDLRNDWVFFSHTVCPNCRNADNLRRMDQHISAAQAISLSPPSPSPMSISEPTASIMSMSVSEHSDVVVSPSALAPQPPTLSESWAAELGWRPRTPPLRSPYFLLQLPLTSCLLLILLLLL